MNLVAVRLAILEVGHHFLNHSQPFLQVFVELNILQLQTLDFFHISSYRLRFPLLFFYAINAILYLFHSLLHCL